MAAESPFISGLVQRQYDYSKYARNSLANIHGFSSFQFEFGQNPKLPSIFNDKPPAFTPPDTNKILTDNLIALHKAREAFIFSENSEKICCTLNNNIRTNVKYITGDKVYYKRANDRRWKGLASVLGQDGQQVLVKHGSHYICVHPSRLTLERTPITIQSKNESPQETQQQQQHNQERQHTAYYSEEEVQQNSPTDRNPPFRTEDDMRDLNASLGQLSVTD